MVWCHGKPTDEKEEARLPPVRPVLSSGSRGLVALAGMASLLDSAAVITVGIGLPLWKAEYGVGAWGLGAISAAVAFGVAVGSLLGGAVADTWGRGRTFVLTLAVFSAGAALVAAAHGTTVIVLGAVVMGLAAGADLPASIALVADSAPPAVLGRAIALTHAMWVAGVLVASLLGLLLSDHGVLGLRVTFACLALAALATAGLRARAMLGHRSTVASTETHQVRRGSSRIALREALVDRTSLRLVVALAAFFTLYTLVANTMGGFRIYFLTELGGAGQTTATALALGASALAMVASVAFSRIADSSWRRRLYWPGTVLLVASQAVSAVLGPGSLTAWIVTLVLFSLSFAMTGEALYKVWVHEVFSSDVRATVQGATIGVARLVAAGFALVTPSLLQHHASALLWGLVLSATGAGLVGAALHRRGTADVRQSTPAPPARG